jgi:hypothetical protein
LGASVRGRAVFIVQSLTLLSASILWSS